MNEEKRFGGVPQGPSGTAKDGPENKSPNAASRARNRTVMLTPEMTGQVRALLYQDQGESPGAGGGGGGGDEGRRDPINELLPPMDWSRPDRQGVPGLGGDMGRETGMAADDFGRDLMHHAETERDSRGGSTGKIDTAPVHEALAQHAAPEPMRRPQAQAPAAGPGFSVNAAASSRSQPSSTSVGARRFGGDPRQRVAPMTRIVGFFISFDREKNGEVHEIRAGRWLVTSRPTDQGEYLLIEDPSVSPLHAIVRATKDGKIEVLDQLSEFGTTVIKSATGDEVDAAGVRVSVGHGDIVRFGERAFVICTVPKVGSIDHDDAEA